MIRYITGAPGSGKSLWTLMYVRKMADEEKRQVYTYNIPGLNIPGWLELTEQQARNPHDLPQGSIIICDEAWQLWPQSKAGVKVPENIENFATHRHRGHDFFIITQRTTSVHHFIRGLIGQHIHFERQFGLPRARKFEWQRLGNPTDQWDKKAATASEFIYPKEVFGWYKSSDQHTVKVKLPKYKLIGIGVMFLVVIVLGIVIANNLTNLDQVNEEQNEVLAKTAAVLDQTSKVTADRLAAMEDKIAALEWANRFIERVPGQPMSAAFYDALVEPAAVPRISGCSQIKVGSTSSCSCQTQQGSRIYAITEAQCLVYLKNGWFDPLKPDEPDPTDKDQGLGGREGGAGSGATPPPLMTTGNDSAGLQSPF